MKKSTTISAMVKTASARMPASQRGMKVPSLFVSGRSHAPTRKAKNSARSSVWSGAMNHTSPAMTSAMAISRQA